MKPNHIKHPLREIKLEYKNEEALNEFESSAVKEYVRLHDVTHDLTKRRDAMAGEELRLELWLQQCEDGLPAIEQELIKCGPAAGYTWEELDKLGVSGAEVDLGEVIQIVTAYQDEVTKWLEATKALYELYLKWHEESNTVYDEVERFEIDCVGKMFSENNDHTLITDSLSDDLVELYHFQYELDAESAFVISYKEYVQKQNDYIGRANELFDRANKVSQVADEVLKTNKNSGFGLN